MPGIDLSMNLPPQPADADLDGRLARALAEVRAESGLAPYLTYQQPGGTGAERKAAAEWLGGMVADLAGGLTADRLILAPGTQPALFALLLAHAAPGDAILTEKLTYPGFKAAAAALGVALIGVEMDGEGMIPGALDRAARGGTAKIVYLTPTMQNPTTATMSADRRKRIAAVVRKRGLVLIEDDPYTFLAPGLPPISSFVPERSYFAASLSKAIAPGLRTSIVVAPDAAAAARCAALLRAVVQMSSPLMAAIATQWMRDGTAADLIKATRKETAARQTLARDALQGQDAIAHPAGLHVWLGLPNRWPAPRFVAHLGGRGLAVVTADAFATDAAPPNAIRLALGAARNQAQLARALAILAEALGEGATGDVIV
ncbi:PLP-dependent aminotransferase family protein [Hyphomicrobium nitrativorans]|uniref:aminotransferase-like domain-containing protein n=1 Tax=Hyphomicrobium nitrativorans TaxID=1427356 RepID=UPI000A887481|nr:PLP-dependent aminotransferase family protein [Hyphomicrobium nitrativorans]